jgi:NAD(P)-dependent dehydrogenase (short-subunit alcohol dehydrogenase family)
MARRKTSTPVAVVTGAGSGVGRATALKFAREGWNVALLGRRADALAETIAQAPNERVRGSSRCPAISASRRRIDATAREVLRRFERVDVLVNAAGNNIPSRALANCRAPTTPP